MLLGTLFGLLAVSLVHNTIGNYIAHSDTATALDLLAALWVAWPFYSRAWSERKALLHPPVRRYKLPLKHVFAKVRQILGNTTYNFGDKWYVSSADTVQKRITACLRFTDEEQRIDLSPLSHHTSLRKERKQRLLELEVQMEEEEELDDSTLIQFDFRAIVEGLSWHACDRIIYAFLQDVQTQLGLGEIADTQQKAPAKSSPPWWLIALTVLCLLNVAGAVGNHISNSWQKIAKDVDSTRPAEIAAGLRRTGR